MSIPHYIALTIDGDPDGPAGERVEPDKLSWDGLEHMLRNADRLRSLDHGRAPAPITWFVRADDVIARACGQADAVFHRYGEAWRAAQALGDEIGWHPHLMSPDREGTTVISTPREACAQLERTWEHIAPLPYTVRSFRNGEAWHTAETLLTVEKLGLDSDSSAVPGCCGPPGHPRDWRDAPNLPYFPSMDVPCQAGLPRKLIEIPMTTWWLQGPDELKPKRRYVNPAVQPAAFRRALGEFVNAFDGGANTPTVTTMVFHPYEVLATVPAKGLMAQSLSAVVDNVQWFARMLRQCGHSVTFVTLAQLSELCRKTLGNA